MVYKRNSSCLQTKFKYIFLQNFKYRTTTYYHQFTFHTLRVLFFVYHVLKYAGNGIVYFMALTTIAQYNYS